MNALPVNEITPENINKDRTRSIFLGGEEYELLLSTLATKSISQRYGGLENLGDKLQGSEKFEDVIDEVCWLIALLANQTIQIYNLTHETKKELLTTEKLMLLSTPYDFMEYKNAIMDAMVLGSNRHIKSEETETKNAQAE